MKRLHVVIPVLCLVAVFSSHVLTQPAFRTMYVAERSGLNLREKSDAAAKRLLSVPYGTKLQVSNTGVFGEAEGIKDTWYKTSYNGKEGYLLGVYLSSMPTPQASCGSYYCYFGWLTGTKDEGKMRNILEQKYGISYNEGGKTCVSGYITGFGSLPLKDAFLLTRLLYGKEFPALNQKFSSIAKIDSDGSVSISMTKKIPGGFKEIAIYKRGNSISFEELDNADPCGP